MAFRNDEPCYYERLGIDPEASQEEIKRAYKKKALQLHPDKNLENIEAATETFKAVQKAYDTLSDPEERIKYNIYRESIIRVVPKEKPDDSTSDLHPDSESMVAKRSSSYEGPIYFWNESEDNFERRQMKQQKKRDFQNCRMGRNVEIRRLVDSARPLDERVKKSIKKKEEEKKQLQKQTKLSEKEGKLYSCEPCKRKFKVKKDLHAHEISEGHKNKLVAMSSPKPTKEEG